MAKALDHREPLKHPLDRAVGRRVVGQNQLIIKLVSGINTGLNRPGYRLPLVTRGNNDASPHNRRPLRAGGNVYMQKARSTRVQRSNLCQIPISGLRGVPRGDVDVSVSACDDYVRQVAGPRESAIDRSDQDMVAANQAEVTP